MSVAKSAPVRIWSWQRNHAVLGSICCSGKVEDSWSALVILDSGSVSESTCMLMSDVSSQ